MNEPKRRRDFLHSSARRRRGAAWKPDGPSDVAKARQSTPYGFERSRRRPGGRRLQAARLAGRRCGGARLQAGPQRSRFPETSGRPAQDAPSTVAAMPSRPSRRHILKTIVGSAALLRRLRGVCLRHRAGVPPARPALRAETPRLAGRSVAADRGGGRHPHRRALHAAVAESRRSCQRRTRSPRT